MIPNFIELKKLSRRKHYIYVDSHGYLADQIFIDSKIPVKFYNKEFVKEGVPYVFVYCSIQKEYVYAFETAMGELRRKQILLGNTDYNVFVNNTIGQIMDRKYVQPPVRG